ncbi:MAG: hypothetical protein IPM34_00905 [Saprospiraceae bacterium]|nr:hypothetical protein [Saprospiraceae bacterium]
MNRMAQWLVGPELYWLLMYLLVVVLIQASHSPVKYMDAFWIKISVFVPLIILPLSFGLYYLEFVPKRFLLIRLIIAGVLGCHFVIEKGLNAYTEQGPGVGSSYMVGIILLLIVLFVLTVIALFKY